MGHRIVQLDPEILVNSMLKHGRYEVIDGLPRDAEFMGAYFNHAKNLFEIVFQSEAWEQVPKGEIIPTFGDITVRKWHQHETSPIVHEDNALPTNPQEDSTMENTQNPEGVNPSQPQVELDNQPDQTNEQDSSNEPGRTITPDRFGPNGELLPPVEEGKPAAEREDGGFKHDNPGGVQENEQENPA